MDEIEQECTCQRADCYSCRRQAIDQTAERIYRRELKYCSGMGFDVEEHAQRMAADYRYKAINALAFEFSSN